MSGSSSAAAAPRSGRAAPSVVTAVLVVAAIPLLDCSETHEIPTDLASRMRPTFGSIQREVFSAHCARSGCHGGRRPESQLSLERGKAYENLVNVQSVQVPDMVRVEPYRSDRSYLIRKLEGGDIVGEPMPRATNRLSSDATEVIRRWIDRGAPRD